MRWSASHALHRCVSQGNLLVPPCIARNEAGQTQVRIDIEDRAHRPALVRISADSVRIHITINVAQEGANEVRPLGWEEGCQAADKLW